MTLTFRPIYGTVKIAGLKRLPEFNLWFMDQKPKARAQIAARLQRILNQNHFGQVRNLGDGLAELKWVNGLRVYFSVTPDLTGQIVILIIGGNKNGQTKDINSARKILRDFQTHST